MLHVLQLLLLVDSLELTAVHASYDTGLKVDASQLLRVHLVDKCAVTMSGGSDASCNMKHVHKLI